MSSADSLSSPTSVMIHLMYGEIFVSPDRVRVLKGDFVGWIVDSNHLEGFELEVRFEGKSPFGWHSFRTDVDGKTGFVSAIDPEEVTGDAGSYKYVVLARNLSGEMIDENDPYIDVTE